MPAMHVNHAVARSSHWLGKISAASARHGVCIVLMLRKQRPQSVPQADPLIANPPLAPYVDEHQTATSKKHRISLHTLHRWQPRDTAQG
jgi:hypothetical protein